MASSAPSTTSSTTKTSMSSTTCSARESTAGYTLSSGSSRCSREPLLSLQSRKSREAAKLISSLQCGAHVLRKIFDLFLYDGEVVLYKTALAVMKIIGQEVIQLDFELGLLLIRSCTSNINEKTLIKLIQDNHLTKEKLHIRMKKELQKIKASKTSKDGPSRLWMKINSIPLFN